jgi:dolichol-phosphate mannosyltransferase
MKALIVIPTYNEKETIEGLLAGIFEIGGLDVLIVDDNSPDGTGALVDRIRKQQTRLFVLHRAGKQGLGSAYRNGFTWGIERGYEQIVQMDGDGSHDPSYIPMFLNLSERNDLVLGSRYIQGGGADVGWSGFRKTLSKLGNWYTNLILFLKDRRYRLKDSTGGFKCWRADFLKQIDMQMVRSDGYAFQIEMNWIAIRHGARVRETPIIFHDRKQGKSKLARSGVVKTFFLPLTLK